VAAKMALVTAERLEGTHGFADAPGWLGAGDDVDFDLAGGFVHAKDFVVVEITSGRHGPLVTVISLLRAWARPKFGALHLGFDAEGV